MFVKNAVKTAFLLCSSLIGAGFATGREVCEYFPGNGLNSIFAPLFSCFVMAVFIFIIIKYKSRISENTVFRSFVFLFSVCTVSAMFAGAACFGCGRFIMTAAVVLTYMSGLSGTETAGMILTPVMAAYILISAVLCGDFSIPQKSGMVSHPFIYAGFNLLTFPILLKNSKNTKPLTTSLLVFMIMAVLITAVSAISAGYCDFEMPLFAAVGGEFSCKLILLAAMYTTAACSSFCMADIAGKKYGYFGIFLAFCTSFFGFGKIVSSGYRVFGIIGFAVCLLIAAEYIRETKIKKKDESQRKYEQLKE